MTDDDPLDPTCPCASGKRLRQCCALASGPDEDDADTEPVLKRVLEFGSRGEFATSRRRLNRSLLAELTDAQGEALDRHRDQDLQMAILVFLHLDLPCHRGQSLGTLFLQREGQSLPPLQRSVLANMVAHPTSLYEIVDVFPGQGLELRDLLRQFTVRVRERTASTMVQPGWLLLTKVRRQPDGTPVMDIPLLHFDDDMRPAADRWLSGQRGTDPTTRIEPRAVLAELYRLWQLAMATVLTEPRDVRLQNHQGEPLELCEAELRGDGKRLRAWLRKAPDWAPDEEDPDDDGVPPGWTWFEPTKDGTRRKLGHIEVAGNDFLLHVNSRARLERAVTLLGKVAGATLVDVTTTTAAELMERARSGTAPDDEPAEPEIPDEVRQQVVQQALDKHYRGWLDEKLPMFGGRTPREMARTDPEAVARAIWTICHSPGVPYDGRWLYAELGLQPLGEGPFSAGVVGN